MLIHAYPRLVARIRNVGRLTNKPCAHVCPNILAAHLLVVRNVHRTLNVPLIKPALTKNVKTLALALAARTPSVAYVHIAHIVVVAQVTPVMHLCVVSLCHHHHRQRVNRTVIHVYLHHVVSTPFVV